MTADLIEVLADDDANLTPWFPADVKPSRVGVYQARLSYTSGRLSGPEWCRWNGREWGNNRQTFREAAQDDGGGQQNKPWRGLTTNPAEAAK